MRWKSFTALLLALSLVLGGCATTLPDAKGVVANTPASEPPEIQGARKALSPRQARKLIKKLEKDAGPSGILDRQVSLMQAVSGARLFAGNKATLLMDGPATYKAMFEVIGAAKDSVNLETFIFDDDETGRKFADLLIEKAGQGVAVSVVYDSVGCMGTPAEFFKRLKDGGVRTLEYNPVNPAKARRKWRITQRDHRKILVVDGKTAFTGGVNISGVYTSGLSPKSGPRALFPGPPSEDPFPAGSARSPFSPPFAARPA